MIALPRVCNCFVKPYEQQNLHVHTHLHNTTQQSRLQDTFYWFSISTVPVVQERGRIGRTAYRERTQHRAAVPRRHHQHLPRRTCWKQKARQTNKPSAWGTTFHRGSSITENPSHHLKEKIDRITQSMKPRIYHKLNFKFTLCTERNWRDLIATAGQVTMKHPSGRHDYKSFKIFDI